MSSPAVSSAIAYSRDNQKRFLKELKDLLRIPSVSDRPKSTKTMSAKLPRWWLPN